MIRIRPAGAADGPAIARIRAETWQVTYAGVLPEQLLADMTDPESVVREGEWRRAHSMDGVLIAECPESPAGGAVSGAPASGAAAGDTGPGAAARLPASQPGTGSAGAATTGAAAGGPQDPVGFAAYGPERAEDDEPGQPGGDREDHGPAELYAIYVVPRQWSTGAGRALLDGVLALAAGDGYTDISLWVLEANARARNFYEQAGFAPTGEAAVLARLDGVMQVRYRRMLDQGPG
jgi:GNAT superfamily N-acetyltransferase